MSKPMIISAPEPRTLDLIFRPTAKQELMSRYDIVETTANGLVGTRDDVLSKARYLIGQPPISEALAARMKDLRCIFNVEGNLTPDMPYETLLARGTHVVTPLSVFAQPVAEIGLGMALDLLRQITASDRDFDSGLEVWGLEGNLHARCLHGMAVGMIGYGEIGRALHRLLRAFDVDLRVFDPWLPASIIKDAGATPSAFEDVLKSSDLVFVVAGVTSENRGFIDAHAFETMRPGAAFVLLSRADVVDFDALLSAVATGHITAASDVWPEEPLPPDHPARTMKGLLRSAHRAGALTEAFFMMGDYLLEDMALLDRGLPPIRCRRAERETVRMMRSRPVDTN